MRILITNDDGINAPGLKTLARIAAAISKDVWTVAPEVEQSGAGHSLTLHDPLRVRKISPHRFAVKGTPTDCVMIALHSLVSGRRPDLILSGVNRGANLAEDVTYSGTVAAAMEGTLLGVPSVAMSQVFLSGHPVKWKTAEEHAPPLLKKLLKAGWPENVLININFPNVSAKAVTGAKACAQGFRTETDVVFDRRVDTRSNPYYWLGFRRESGNPMNGTDLAVVAKGGIAVSPLQLDLTHRKTLKHLRAAVK